MALSRTEIQKRSNEKRGIVQKNFKLPRRQGEFSDALDIASAKSNRRGRRRILV